MRVMACSIRMADVELSSFSSARRDDSSTNQRFPKIWKTEDPVLRHASSRCLQGALAGLVLYYGSVKQVNGVSPEQAKRFPIPCRTLA